MKMIKKIFIILLLLIPLTYAQINLEKDSFNQKETIISEIHFNNLQQDILPSDINIRSFPNNELQPTYLNLKKINKDTYYLYFQLDNPGKYIINIENIKYLENNILKQTTMNKNIEITQQIQNISISPGVFVYKQGVPAFKLKIKNNLDTANTIVLSSNSSALQFPYAVTIPGKNEKTITVKLDLNTEESKIILNLNSYKIPIFLTSKEDEKENEKIVFFLQTQGEELQIEKLSKQIKEKTTYQATIEIQNKFNISKTFNVSLTNNLKEIIQFFPASITIEPEKKSSIDLVINEDKSPKEFAYQGDLELKTEDYLTQLPISFAIEKQVKEEPIESFCGDGICDEDENNIICIEDCQPQEPIESFCGDNVCDTDENEIICSEDCSEQKQPIPTEEKSNSRIFISLIIIIILILIIFFVIRKPIQKQGFEDIIKKRTR